MLISRGLCGSPRASKLGRGKARSATHKAHLPVFVVIPPGSQVQPVLRASLDRSPCGDAPKDGMLDSAVIGRVLALEGITLAEADLSCIVAAVPELWWDRLHDNIKGLMKFLTVEEVKHVLRVAPTVLSADLCTWFEFLQQFGFTNEQISYLLCQAPQALAQANLMTAGQAFTTMREAGLDEGSARALVVSYPQLLHTSHKDISAMLRTLARFSTGVLDCGC